MEDIRWIDYGELTSWYNASMLPAYVSAIRSLPLPDHSLGFDAGCGPGGLLPLFDSALHQTGYIIGGDVSLPHLVQAQRTIKRMGMQTRASVQYVNLLESLPFENHTFDWAWASDVFWAQAFPQPEWHIRELGRVVKPGGIIALFYGNLLRSMLLPGYEVIEHYVQAACFRKKLAKCEARPELRPELADSWLRAAGLRKIHYSAHVASGQQPLRAEVRNYLGHILQHEYGSLAQSDLERAGLPPQYRKTWESLITPESSAYILDQRDYRFSLSGMLFYGYKSDQ